MPRKYVKKQPEKERYITERDMVKSVCRIRKQTERPCFSCVYNEHPRCPKVKERLQKEKNKAKS